MPSIVMRSNGGWSLAQDGADQLGQRQRRRWQRRRMSADQGFGFGR